MREYFTRSVEVVKKEIARRTNKISLNFYNSHNPITINDFRKIDYYHLLELVLTNERIKWTIEGMLFGVKVNPMKL